MDDHTLVQRIRSSLGPLEKQLDLPRVRASATDGMVVLHGGVTSAEEARRLVRATERIAGVRAVRSHLHVGLSPGDTRPSAGRRIIPDSAAWKELVGAARGLRLSDDSAERATRAVLATFLACLPDDERRHLLAHLPEDVRQRAHGPLEVGRPARPRSAGGFDRAVADCAQLPIREAAQATRAVLDSLRALAPEEADDVTAVLPSGLKALWVTPSTVGT